MVVAREALLDRAPEDREIMRGGQLLRRWADPTHWRNGCRHSERMRLLGHELGEALLVAADGFGDRDRDVVRRPGDDRLDRILDRDRRARPQTELGRLLRGGMGRDSNIAVEPHAAFFELLEQKIKRHHLGDRGREAAFVFVAGVKRLAGIAVDDDRRDMGCRTALAWARR